ncbi:MAG: UvrD-helicase domain-containing protein [Ignavibacteriaceae bacterium]|nr:UvrD-helicase domain-containing protein [Ignavibacteriaceae bacterium]
MRIDLSVLNEEQRKAVEEIEGPSMIIAGAGSGKTRVLTYKIAHLIESGVNPFEILALTFTNKAAREMKERVDNLVGHYSQKLWMGTFHSIFAKILGFDGDKLGYTRNFSIYDSDDAVNAVKQSMISCSIPTENPTPKTIYGYISNLKNKMVLPHEFSSIAKNPLELKVATIYKDYQQVLRKSNAMDFDDLLLNPIYLFRQFPDVLERYQDRFKFILVDEYQDTNKAQYLIVKLLASKYRNLTIVGDDAQSIYKWRGAEIQNIFDFSSDFTDAKIFRLEKNYRSTKKILKLADDVIKRNKRQIEKTLWTDNDDGDNIVINELMTDRDEALKVVTIIHNEMRRKKINYKDFVILYRTNAQSRLFEDSLRNNKIPYVIIGGIRFYQRKEIKDVLCNLKVIVNPKDDEALKRLFGLTEGIGKTSVDRLIQKAEIQETSIYDVLKNIDGNPEFGGAVKNRLVGVLNFIRKYQYLKDEVSVSELARMVIDEAGVIRKLREENTPESEDRISNIMELASAIAEYSENNDNPTLEEFLQEVSLVADIDNLDNQKNAVTLMTIHSAKGLEFPVVFITGLEEGLFPVGNSFLSDDELEEERRLFYVAITRAMNNLYMSHANQRYKFGVQSYQMKSRFLKDISNDLLNSIIDHAGLKLNVRNPNIEPKKKSHSATGASIRYEHYKSRRSNSAPENDKFPDIKKGVVVVHNTFGKGTVLGTNGKGLDKKAEIYFEDVGLKKIVLKYAKMTVNEI